MDILGLQKTCRPIVRQVDSKGDRLKFHTFVVNVRTNVDMSTPAELRLNGMSHRVFHSINLHPFHSINLYGL